MAIELLKTELFDYLKDVAVKAKAWAIHRLAWREMAVIYKDAAEFRMRFDSLDIIRKLHLMRSFSFSAFFLISMAFFMPGT